MSDFLAMRRRRAHPVQAGMAEVAVSETDGIRAMYLGSDTMQSAMRIADPCDLVLAYTRATMAFLMFQPDPRRILHVGLGGGSLPRFCHARLPHAVNVAVEINPQVVALCRSQFALPDDERMQVVVDDGIDYVARQTQAFDVIVIDAFDGRNIITAMVAEPFLHDCRMALRDGGVLAVNLWSRHPRYHEHVEAMRLAFDGKVLVLPAETHGNIVAFAFSGISGNALRFDALAARAGDAGLAVGLDLAAMVPAMKKHNPHSGARLML